MKKFYKQILILLPFVFLFSSCVDITRNIKLNKDGSGSETMNINISSQFFQMMKGLAALDTTKKIDVYQDSTIISEIKKNFKGNDLIELKDLTSANTPDSGKNLKVDYDFKDIKAIAVSMDDDEASKSKSSIYMKEQGDIIKFYYEMANQDSENDNSMSELNGQMFEGRQFILSIEFPYDVISSNATTQEGRKLTWVRPMNVISKAGSKEIFEAELRK
ncbi:MAG: hypothetical protein JST55_00780 [Bacteroidetes bacterium]|nr:hypothetical protein [Bacteroidota bacterium]